MFEKNNLYSVSFGILTFLLYILDLLAKKALVNFSNLGPLISSEAVSV